MDAAAHIRQTHARHGALVSAALCEALINATANHSARRKLHDVGKELGLIEAREAEEARRARLSACPMHVFDMTGIERAAGKIPPRLTCVMCDEWMPTLEAAAYARGFAAAGGDPETVIEGFGR